MKAAFVLCFFLLSSATYGQESKYDWLMIYYMPYDNNLSPLADTIVNQFVTSPISNRSCVILQTDLAGAGGMRRYIINEDVATIDIDEEHSASPETFTSYLTWISENFKADHYAIVLLSHGGLINEYGLDEYPTKQWLPIDSLALSIRHFNKLVGISKVDLLFEQVCSRGTLENLFEFRDVSKFTLASQHLVPAPGYYYSHVFSSLDNVKAGDELADLIVRSEHDDMYYSLTLVDNSKWTRWAKLFDQYSRKIQKDRVTLISDSLKVLTYWGGLYFDFSSLIKGSFLSGRVPSEGVRLLSFTNHQLIGKLYINQSNSLMNDYLGISIISPFISHDVRLSIHQDDGYQNWLQSLKRNTR